MQETFILMLIFSAALLVSTFSLYRNKNPKQSVFFTRYPIDKMTDEAAKRFAEKTAKGVGLIGIVTAAACVVGLLLNGTAGAILLIVGNLAALFAVGKYLKD